jgi:magnesium transporter
VISAFVHRNGATQTHPSLDPAWLAADSGAVVWVDLSNPTAEELRVLSDVFHFHPLAVEDAVAERHHPKIELYGSYLYLILHGIDFRASQHRFATHDTDFFLGPNYLVTVHDGQTRTIPSMHDQCVRNSRLLAQGPVALMHRIVDAMVDHYRPEVDKLEHKLDQLERTVFESPDQGAMREILELKRDVTSLRRVTLPQRDAVARLARREFALISDEMAYRFRDVFDQSGREGADGHHDDLHAADAPLRAVRHERSSAAASRWGIGAVLVGGRDHGDDDRRHARGLSAATMALVVVN